MSLGIYIHIPFCIHKCNYCDFNSYVAKRDMYAIYTEALCKEIESMSEIYDDEVDSIYFGGGTPTVLSAAQLTMILDTVKGAFELTEDCEITTECNPATMRRDEFAELVKAGFNRLSIGMQTANEDELKMLGRIHSFEDCKICVNDAKEAGFNNISLDLMFGIPKQDLMSFKKSLMSAIELKPQHLSCYSLKVEEGTPFASMDLDIADDDLNRQMYDDCVAILSENGYKRYEVSNFAREGRESRHNIKYWRCDDFIGFGAGAYSCIDDMRYSNIINTEEYVNAIELSGSVIGDKIPLSIEDKMSEYVYLGLRMDKGISISEFSNRFGMDIDEVFGIQLDKNIKRGTIIKDGDRLKISPEFVYVSNIILTDFV